jgi:ubiquitin-protein ligase
MSNPKLAWSRHFLDLSTVPDVGFRSPLINRIFASGFGAGLAGSEDCCQTGNADALSASVEEHFISMTTQSPSDRRLSRIHHDLTRVSPLPGVSIALADNQIRKWVVEIEGPAGSYYADDTFTVTIDWAQWPKAIPKVLMVTPIVHPNISHGAVCLDLLRHRPADKPINPRDLLDALVNALKNPDFNRALDLGVANEYKKSPDGFEKLARQQVSANVLARLSQT